MKKTKLPEDERASQLEKVILMCSELQFAATNLFHIMRDYKIIIREGELKNRDDEALKIGLKEKETAMDNLINNLLTTREEFMEFMNGIDAVNDFDVKFSTLIFNAVNDMTEAE